MSNIIKISKEFHINGEGLWLGTEISIPEESTEEQKIDAFKKEHATLVKAAQVISGQSNSMPYYSESSARSIISQEPPVINRAAERLEIMIDKCTTLDELMGLQSEVNKYDMVGHFNKKFDELQNKQS